MSAERPASLDDTVFQQRLKEIIHEYHIKVIVETGLHWGDSTIILAKMLPHVIGIENNITSLVRSVENIHDAGVTNVTCCLGSSPWVLKSLQTILPDETLYFLDAHWQQYWPLLDEILSLRKGTGIIVLHDVLVPGRTDLGYDTYGKQPLDYKFVKESLTSWSPTHRIEYNSKVEGTLHPRGIMYVYPK